MRVRRYMDIGRADRCRIIACSAVFPHEDMILPTKLGGNKKITIDFQ